MRVNVIGLGYIGLPTAMIMAANGVEVIGTDYNKSIVDMLINREVTYKEEGLDDLLQKAVNNGILFTTDYVAADIYVVSVPTPYNKNSKKIDPSYIVNAMRSILNVSPKGAIVIIESTISPGTIDNVVRPMIEQSGKIIGEDIHLAHAPERIIPGRIIYELENNSRTIGVDDKNTGEIVKKLYQLFCKGNIVLTDIRTAEMTKVVENTYRDINIAFANELAKICRSANLDVYEVIRIANMHPRVNILQPGPGVGGHCISVDPWFLVGDYPGLANIILAARKINDSMPEYVLERVHEIMKENNITDFSRIGIYGLTYKENVDDIRESPSLQLLENMDKHLAPRLKSYDPYVKNDITINQFHDLDQFLSEVDLVIIMVGHNEIIQNMDKLKNKIILDTRNICHIEGTYKL